MSDDPLDELTPISEDDVLRADEPTREPSAAPRSAVGMIDIHPMPIRVGGTIHIAAQAVNRVTGARGPLLSAEGCNLDDSVADHVDYAGGEKCQRCNLPVTGEEEEPQ